jgi:hypothetical protein
MTSRSGKQLKVPRSPLWNRRVRGTGYCVGLSCDFLYPLQSLPGGFRQSGQTLFFNPTDTTGDIAGEGLV